MPEPKPTSRNPWAWIPTLYVAEGLPYVLVMILATVPNFLVVLFVPLDREFGKKA
jgi:hypothetical protein